MNSRMRSLFLLIVIALSSITSLARAEVPNLKNLQLNLDDIDPADHDAIRKVYDKALPLAANYDPTLSSIFDRPDTTVYVVKDVIKKVREELGIVPKPEMVSEMKERFYAQVWLFQQRSKQNRIYIAQDLFSDPGKVAASLSHCLFHVKLEPRKKQIADPDAFDHEVYRQSLDALKAAKAKLGTDELDAGIASEERRKSVCYALAWAALQKTNFDELEKAAANKEWVGLYVSDLAEMRKAGKQIIYIAIIRPDTIKEAPQELADLRFSAYDLAAAADWQKSENEKIDSAFKDRPQDRAQIVIRVLPEEKLKNKQLLLGMAAADEDHLQVARVFRKK